MAGPKGADPTRVNPLAAADPRPAGLLAGLRRHAAEREGVLSVKDREQRGKRQGSLRRDDCFPCPILCHNAALATPEPFPGLTIRIPNPILHIPSRGIELQRRLTRAPVRPAVGRSAAGDLPGRLEFAARTKGASQVIGPSDQLSSPSRPSPTAGRSRLQPKAINAFPQTGLPWHSVFHRM